ncbi:MAG: hypothetical protein IID40_00170 [Planctomycetes bacterium]|nr:hypothetical protein [Planctomycetota bacterium]
MQRAANGSRTVEVGVGHLQVVLHRHRMRIADPGAHDVCREHLHQLGFTGGAQVLKQLWPGRQPRPLDDPVELGAEVLLGVPVAGYHVLGAFLRLLEYLAQMWQQLREQRKRSGLAALMVFGLGAADDDSAARPVDVGPT